MKSNHDSPMSESVSASATNRMSPPIIVDATLATAETATVHIPRKAAGNNRPPLATASQSSKGEQNKGGMRRLEKQAEVEETDALLHEQHKHEQQSAAVSPTTLGGAFPEVPRPVASLDVPGRPASFDSSSLTSNGAMPTPQNSIEKQNSLERPARLGYSENSSPAISRDSSTECNPYTDYTGTDLEAFIRIHLNKSAKDREVLMSIEQRLSDFVKQGKTQCYSFPQMSSYHRMFVHRVSAYFGLDHNVDQTGKAVIVSLTPNTRVPDLKFRELCSDLPTPTANTSETRKLILKRDSSDDASRQANIALENTLAFGNLVHGGTPASSGAGSPRAASVDGSLFPGSDLPGLPTRSFEEREADYQKARRRIFNEHEQQAQQSANCLGSPSSHPQYTTPVPSWGSTDNPHIGQNISGPYIAKANSFGGTSVHPQSLQQQQQQQQPQSAQRAIPINVPAPSSTPQNLAASPTVGTLVIPQPQQPQQRSSSLLGVPPGAVYVLAPSVDYVTAGSVVISPQSGEAFLKRPDGSLQPVILGTVNSSPTNAGSPVQSAPSPQVAYISPQSQQPSSSQPPAPSQPILSRFLVASMPAADQSQQAYAIVGQAQPPPPQQDVPANLHEVLNRLSIISSSDLTQYTTATAPPPAGTGYIQQPPQSQPIILASMPIPGSQSAFSVTSQQSQNNGSFAAPVASFQLSTNGQYIYQVAPTSLLTGPPPSNQPPQSPEVGPPQLSTGPEGASPLPPQPQPQPQCWILTNSSPSGATPSDPSTAPRQVIILPTYPSPYPKQSQQPQAPQQVNQSGQQTMGQGIEQTNYARGQPQAPPTTMRPTAVYYDQQAQQTAQQQQQQQQSQSQTIRAFAAANPPPPVPPRQVHSAHPRSSNPQQFITNANNSNVNSEQ